MLEVLLAHKISIRWKIDEQENELLIVKLINNPNKFKGKQHE